ncbi:MAG: response regulator, partial [Planctomycetes bacterium RBG_16_64_10]
MHSPGTESMVTPPKGVTAVPITVLLVDDQAIIGAAVQRMLADESDITLHYCQDPTKALQWAGQVHPTVILQDLVMPEVDGLTLLKFFRANPATRDTPMIVLSTKEEPVIKAEAFALGANDYLVKLPDRIELVARIRYHSRGYISLLQRNEAYEALRKNEERLAREIAAGVQFVRSLLPEPITEPVRVDWRYIPSADLGGDTFGYHSIDEDRFAIYLLDVSGHGLDSALFSVTIMNVLRSRSLPADFSDPGQVLASLNDAFPMELYGDKFFTMWYGVYNRLRSELVWCNGGHPPALLFPGAGQAEPPLRLQSENPMLGAFPGLPFETRQNQIAPGTRLYVYSDGVHEIHKLDGGE